MLLEVNIGEEEAKSGFLPARTCSQAAQAAKELPHVRVRGLDGHPAGGERSRMEVYHILRKCTGIYVDINEKLYDNEFVYLIHGHERRLMPTPSAAAPTMVRVGTRHLRRPPLRTDKLTDTGGFMP